MIRLDFIFSYWIFAWYLLYMIDVVKYSPKFLLILGIIENTIMAFYLIYNENKSVVMFIAINTVLKLIPYYTIRNDIIKYCDIQASFALFMIYCIWLFINRKSAIKIYYQISDSIIHHKYNTPAMAFITKSMIRFQGLLTSSIQPRH